MGNSVVFPAPEETRIPNRMKSSLYFYNKSRDDEVSSVPSNTPLFCCSDRKNAKRIPFVYLKEETDPLRSQYLIIYFHGNSEVLSSTFKNLERLHKSLKLSVLSAEYPGYGLYDTDSTSEENILENADAIIRYAINTLQYSESNIILVGKSFGTGVAARMGINFPNLKAIAMFSSYLSIREVVTNMVGGTLAKFVPNIFKTKEIVPFLKPPVLFVHGLKDPIVPCTNSSTLYYACNSSKMLIFSTTMDHRKADFRNDMYLPILKFFAEKLEMEEFTAQGNREGISRLSALSNINCIKPKHSPSRTSESFSDLETLSTEGSKKQIGW